jgi:hypothetical protein
MRSVGRGGGVATDSGGAEGRECAFPYSAQCRNGGAAAWQLCKACFFVFLEWCCISSLCTLCTLCMRTHCYFVCGSFSPLGLEKGKNLSFHLYSLFNSFPSAERVKTSHLIMDEGNDWISTCNQHTN